MLKFTLCKNFVPKKKTKLSISSKVTEGKKGYNFSVKNTLKITNTVSPFLSISRILRTQSRGLNTCNFNGVRLIDPITPLL